MIIKKIKNFSIVEYIYFSFVLVSILYVTQFKSLLFFRDIAVIDNFQSITDVSVTSLLQYIFSWLRTYSIPALYIQNTFFFFLFSSGFLLNFSTVLYYMKMLQRRLTIWIPLCVSTLLIFNPFTYERFLMGQYLVLAGLYLVFPVYTIVIYLLSAKKFIVQYICIIVIFTVFAYLSPHYALLCLISIFISLIITRKSVKLYIPVVAGVFSFLVCNYIVYIQNPQFISFASQSAKVIPLAPQVSFSTISMFRFILGLEGWMSQTMIESFWYTTEASVIIVPLFILISYLIYLICIDNFHKSTVKYSVLSLAGIITFLSVIVIFPVLFESVLQLPFAFIMRDIGKLSGVLYIILAILFFSFQYVHMRAKVALISITSICAIPFFFLPQTVIQQTPPLPFRTLSQVCKIGDSVGVIPANSYIIPRDDGVFVANPIRYISQCRLSHPLEVRIQGQLQTKQVTVEEILSKNNSFIILDITSIANPGVVQQELQTIGYNEIVSEYGFILYQKQA